MTGTDGSLAVTFAAGQGDIGEQAVTLLRSVRRHLPDAEVYAFVPSDEHDDMSEVVLDALERDATVLTGSIPIPEYPISTKIGALRAAERETDADYVLLLDTDTVLLDSLDLPLDGEADLFLKPVDVGRQFWGRSRSEEWWRRLYERFDQPFPTRRVNSTFDDREMLPYWNAGFVLARTGTVGEEWLAVTEAIHDDIPYERHADQVALGIVSERYETRVLDNRYNYPLQLHLWCPSDVRVLHYHDRHELARFLSPAVSRELAVLGLEADMDRASVRFLRFIAYAASIWVRRKTLPIDETHALERAYLRVRGLLS